MRPIRFVDTILLLTGLTLLVWATILSRRPEAAEAPSVIAMRSQPLTEGRSYSAEASSPRLAREGLARTHGDLVRR